MDRRVLFNRLVGAELADPIYQAMHEEKKRNELKKRKVVETRSFPKKTAKKQRRARG